MNKGFTLIEILVSLVILSMITIISSSILQSSLEVERISSQRLLSARTLNFSSIIIKRDIRQAINVPLRDFYGNDLKATFVASNLNKTISFNTKVKSISDEASPIKRVEYILENDILKRKQYYSSNPYSSDDFIASSLIENVSEMDISFLHEKLWYKVWPINPNTERKIPSLIKLEFEKDNKEYIWIIEPNIDYVFEN